MTCLFHHNHTFHVSEDDIVVHNIAVVFPLGAALLETKTLCSIGIFIGCCFFQYKTGIKVEGGIDATRGGTSNSSASRSQASPAISSSVSSSKSSSNFDNDGSYSGGGLESQAVVRVRAVEAEKSEGSFSPPAGTYDHETDLIERSRNPTAPKGCHTGPRPQSFYVPGDSADSQDQVCNDMSGDSSDEVESSRKNGGDKNEKCICGHKCLTSNCQCTCSCLCGVKNLEKRKANKQKKRERKERQKKQQAEIPDATKTRPIKFTEEAIEEAVKHGMGERKIHHIFKKGIHNLDQFVQKMGSQEGAMRAVITSLSGKIGEGIFEDVPVEVEGFWVFVRGRVIEGVVKIGTFFIK